MSCWAISHFITSYMICLKFKMSCLKPRVEKNIPKYSYKNSQMKVLIKMI